MSSDNFKISVFFLILLINGYFCKQNETSPSKLNVIDPRVVGGYRPPVHILPKYIVSIGKRNEPLDQFGYSHFCAGSILASNKILTAAHCVMDKETKEVVLPSVLKIVAKTPIRLMKTNHTQEVNVKEVIPHSYFRRRPRKVFYDIALLILENNIILDGQLAAEIILPSKNIKEGSICTLIGWGRIYEKGPTANHILYVDITVQRGAYCRTHYYQRYTTKQICASDSNDGEKDACSGDSGGPLLCNGILTGIVSYGRICGDGAPSVYTDVFKYLDWITGGHSDFVKFVKSLHFITFAVIVFF